MNKLSILTKGIIKENPVLVLLLGCCPTLATTTGAINGLGMGIGFTLALGIMGLIREFLGSGTAFDIPVYANTGIEPAGIFMLAPGGFFVFAILIAAINYFSKGKAIKKKEIGCEGCAMADSCGGACDGKEADA